MEKIRESASLNQWLTRLGKRLYFPTEGVVKQAEESYGARINATAGVFHDDDNKLKTLPCIQKSFGPDTNTLNYAPTRGLKAFREKWLSEMHKKNPSLCNAPITTPIVTNGLTHGINIAGQLFFDENSKIIIADKYWDNYELMCEVAFNAKLKTFPTFENEGYNLNDIEKNALKDPIGKKIFIFNMPNNPTGYSLTKEEQDCVVKIMKKSADIGNKVLVICDDAYFGLNHTDNVAPESLFSKLANAHNNILTVKIDGPTKEELAWGARIGFITIGGKSLSKKDIAILDNKIAGAIRTNASSASKPAQEAILKGLNHPMHDKQKAEAKAILTERFNVCQKILKKNKNRFAKYFTPLPANSGYFVFLKLNEKIDAEKVRTELLQTTENPNIATIHRHDGLRVAYSAVNKKFLPELFESVYNVCMEQL